jgi:hypothetical protein
MFGFDFNFYFRSAHRILHAVLSMERCRRQHHLTATSRSTTGDIDVQLQFLQQRRIPIVELTLDFVHRPMRPRVPIRGPRRLEHDSVWIHKKASSLLFNKNSVVDTSIAASVTP